VVRPKPSKLAVELLRGLILAAVVAGLATQGKISDAGDGLLLGAALWIGFRFVLWTGPARGDKRLSELRPVASEPGAAQRSEKPLWSVSRAS
jgi:hypothetical protein